MTQAEHARAMMADMSRPRIRLAIDGNVAKPYRVFARDAETGTVRTLSRHTSDLAARRAICRYRRLTGSKGE